jgi:hypothetical protein
VVTVDLSTPGVIRTTVAFEAESALEAHDDSSEHAADASRYESLRTLTSAALRERILGAGTLLLETVGLEIDGERVASSLVEVAVPPPPGAGEGRLSELALSAELPPEASELTIRLADPLGQVALRVIALDGHALPTAWLAPGGTHGPMPVAPANPPWWRVVYDYLVLGFTHILPSGIDHVLFVLGLFFLRPAWRPLLMQVTAFTLAHSATLSLAILGLVSLPSDAVEPLIALSIVYVAIENLVTTRLSPWRLAIVFGFGLLHGLGFAGVLGEIGLPRGELVTGLVAFNVGVELGQIAVLALAFGVLRASRAEPPRFRRIVAMPASAGIALVGGYWTVARLFG